MLLTLYSFMNMTHGKIEDEQTAPTKSRSVARVRIFEIWYLLEDGDMDDDYSMMRGWSLSRIDVVHHPTPGHQGTRDNRLRRRRSSTLMIGVVKALRA